MPFRWNRLPSGWLPDDVRTLRGMSAEDVNTVRRTCDSLGLPTREIWGAAKEPRALLNQLLKHRGLPYRDSTSSNSYDDRNADAYVGLLLEVGGISMTLLRRKTHASVAATDVLEYVLNCPSGDLPIHDAFTRQEYDDLFVHSYPAQALRISRLPDADWRRVLDRVPQQASEIVYDMKFEQDNHLVCLRCFRTIKEGVYCPCSGCGQLIHFSSCDLPPDTDNGPMTTRLERSRADGARCAVCENREIWEEWTEARGPSLLGDAEPRDPEEEPLEEKLKKVYYRITRRFE
ncbi:hypothetical protein B0T20DRAFT_353219 [Sordaria brevicollis]|uniref:Uncharacterized protein n=1 Tax=Sordaria brevicollis TaxID=83679 RepID=A0AAE0PF40_SORBR|nr:hypothetical protein B0T20DRAFT_353219 [Sordaria brevicollis]